MKKFLAKMALGLGLVLSFVASGALIAQATTLKFVQTPTTHLYSGQSAAATTMRITPVPADLDGTALTITDFGDTPTLTVDPKISGYEEIENFTTIVNNGDGTATLSGMSRNLTSKSPYSTSGTGRTHGSGATVVFSNNPQMYNRLAAKENNETVAGLWSFNTSPYGSTPTTSAQLATKGYVDGVSIAGAANSSETVNGISQLATALQAASTTSTGSTAARLVLPASIATSSNDVVGLHVVVTQNSGKINWNMIDLGTAATFTAQSTFTAGTLTTASSTVTATSTATAKTIGYNPQFGMTASTTITGATTPQPVYIATTTGAVQLSSANTYGANIFSGFAISSAVNGGSVFVQTGGVVAGFTGLTAGSPYYVQDSIGTIGTATGTSEVYVGQAVSTTQIQIETNRGWQFLGTQNFGCPADTVISQPYARFAVVATPVLNTGSGQGDLIISAIGKKSAIFNINVPASFAAAVTLTWTATSSIRCSGNPGTPITATYYR